ncbi:MAG: hypothetical protein AB6733_12330 [Clostridiaceae bacterium]
MVQVKEFCSDIGIEDSVNGWLLVNQNKKIIDIKYSATLNSSNALIIYEDGILYGKHSNSN